MQQSNGSFFNTGYLHLTDIQNFRNSLLGQTVEVPKLHNGALPLGQFRDCLTQRDFFQHLIF